MLTDVEKVNCILPICDKNDNPIPYRTFFHPYTGFDFYFIIALLPNLILKHDLIPNYKHHQKNN